MVSTRHPRFALIAALALALASLPTFAAIPPTHDTAMSHTDSEREAARRLLERWHGDPVTFAAQALGIQSWDRQAEIMRAVAQHDRVAVRSGHKVGKSKSASALGYWFLHTRPDARVVMTSSGNRQVKDILWREIKATHRDAPFPLGGELHEDPATGLKLDDGREIVGFATKEKEKIAGYSGPNMLFILDEASGIPQDIWEALEGNTAGGAKVVLYSNPTQTSGFFYNAFHEHREFWKLFKVSSWDTPNARTGQRLIPGLAERAYCETMAEKYGVDSPIYAVRVLGEFPSQSEFAVVQLALVERGLEAFDEGGPGSGRLHIGVDVARFGDDDSVLAARRGDRVEPLVAIHGQDTTQIAGKAMAMAQELRQRGERPLVKVDVIGVGAGVADQLRHSPDLEVVDVNVAAAATVQEDGHPGYERLRDQLWFAVRDFLKSGGAIPHDEKLESELVAPTYSYALSGKLKVESKDAIKKRLGRSPDRADAVALALYEPPAEDFPAFTPRPRGLGSPRI